MKTRIVTNADIKTLIGISGATKDALVDMQNTIMTDLLNEILGVTDLYYHAVTDERIQPADSEGHIIVVKDFPIDDSAAITMKNEIGDTLTTLDYEVDENDKCTIRVYDSSGTYKSSVGYSEVLVSYTAGYTLNDLLEVKSYANLIGKTINVKVQGVATVYTFVATGAVGNQINAETSNNVTAANIATKLAGTSSSAIATLPLGLSTSLGTALVADLVITNATIPAQLQFCVALMVAGAIVSPSKAKGVSSYSIGSKSVTLRNSKDSAIFGEIINAFIPNYKRIKIRGI